jgi:PAS domain S-box-containing protein
MTKEVRHGAVELAPEAINVEQRSAASDLLRQLAQDAAAEYEKRREPIPAHVQTALEFTSAKTVFGQELVWREESERSFRVLADAAPIMIWLAGPDALCTFFNEWWLGFRGRTIEQEIGNGWVEGVHADDRDLCLATYLKSFSIQRPFRMEFRLQRADGQYRWVEEIGVPRFERERFFGFTRRPHLTATGFWKSWECMRLSAWCVTRSVPD